MFSLVKMLIFFCSLFNSITKLKFEVSNITSFCVRAKFLFFMLKFLITFLVVSFISILFPLVLLLYTYIHLCVYFYCNNLTVN